MLNTSSLSPLVRPGFLAGLLLLLLTALGLRAQAPAEGWSTPFERSDSLATATHAEAIAFYRRLAEAFPQQAALRSYGRTDAGRPLHLFILDADGAFEPHKRPDKRRVLINNGIHPGEPAGVDACMMYARDLLTGRADDGVLRNTTLLIIPLYNTGGALKGNCCTRANQVGPTRQGFRGNGRNLDLNRDFMKLDSRNARAFVTIFQLWQPDIFVDTHTSDGADYQHTMTLISGQKDKLGPELGTYMHDAFVPKLYERMEAAGEPMSPYVVRRKGIPDSGLVAFLETPRYSTGYAALFQTLPFVTETHMLKSFGRRVQAQYRFLKALLSLTAEEAPRIAAARKRARRHWQQRDSFHLAWELDTTRWDMVDFRGYEASMKPGALTGKPRRHYDRSSPWHHPIRYYNTYRPTVTVRKPASGYLLPQAWREAVNVLLFNGIEFRRLERDTTLRAEVYAIQELNTPESPYEGHYLHSDIRVKRDTQTIRFFAGDYLIPADQPKIRYAVEALEPQSVDGLFAWNFFDEILMRKEYFSAYLFEEKADSIVAARPGLRAAYEQKMAKDTSFAADPDAQLAFIYRHSQYSEASFRRYPVVRLLDAAEESAPGSSH